jgi:hypothetical protein
MRQDKPYQFGRLESRNAVLSRECYSSVLQQVITGLRILPAAESAQHALSGAKLAYTHNRTIIARIA